MKKTFKAHPAAEMFEMMTEAELDQLAADIRQRGQLEPIITTGHDLILDGRNRLEACRRAEVEPYMLVWEEDGNPFASPTAYVLSKNLHRRHLNETQRAVIGEEAERFFAVEAKKRQKAGKSASEPPPTLPPIGGKVPAPGKKTRAPTSAARAAATTGASPRSVERAKAVLKKKPELRALMKAGKLALTKAETAIKKEEALKNVLEYRPPVGSFSVIVTDVSWEYDDKLDGSDQARGGVEYHTQKLDEILKMKIPAAADCALWFWVTNAFLMDGSAARVIEAWGFRPKALLTWRKVDKTGKDRLGAGHYLRNNTEHVILAVKGKPVIDGADQPTFFEAQRGRHSEKPDEFFAIAERVTPCSPEARIELYAVKSERKGWASSGSEQQAAARVGRDAREPKLETASQEDKQIDALLDDGWEPIPNGWGALIDGAHWVIDATGEHSGRKTPWAAYRPKSETTRAWHLGDFATIGEAHAAVTREVERIKTRRGAAPPVDDGTLCGVRPSKNGDGCIHKQGHEGVHSNGKTTWREKTRRLPPIVDVHA